MTVHQPVARFHLPGSALLLVTLALLPGVAKADDCVIAPAPQTAATPKTAAAPAKPRPVVRPAVRRPPPLTEVGVPGAPKAQPAAQAKPQSPTRQRVVVQRKRPSPNAKLVASEQAPTPVPKADATCTPVADPPEGRSRMKEAPRFTPIDPPTRPPSMPSVRRDPLEGIRTGLPGVDPMPPSLDPMPPSLDLVPPSADLVPPGEVALAPPYQMTLVPPSPVVLLPPPMGGGGGGGPELPLVEKPAPPLNPNPPGLTIPPLVIVPPETDRPIDPGTPPDPEQPHPVPIPGSVWLVLVGLAGVFRQRCRALPGMQR
jgi:hypothetical protein